MFSIGKRLLTQLILVFSVSSFAQSEELIYSLPSGETISFYTRVAPDLSSVGFTKTKTGVFKYEPVVLDLVTKTESPLVGLAYDPTYSHDYDLTQKQGFLFGARGGSSSFAKYFLFYLPGEFSQAKVEYYFSNISGYASVAYLRSTDGLPPALHPFVGKYLIFGKRWRWFVVETVLNSSGEVIDVKRVHPATGDLAAEPLCPGLASSFDKSDSMISPFGRYISLKRFDKDKVPTILRTEDCTVISTPALNGLYGGKATFSNDEQFMTFHAFGENGTDPIVDQITNDDLIKKWADMGLVSNLFIYDIQADRVTRVTGNTKTSPAVNFFPNFSGDGAWLYYHRHLKGDDSTKIFRILNPLYVPR